MQLEDALGPQEQAAAVLGEGRGLAQVQLARFNLLQQLIGFEQSVARASDGPRCSSRLMYRWSIYGMCVPAGALPMANSR